MGESQGGGKGLDMSPCSLASAQRVFWEEGGNLDGKRKKRKKRSDSRQVRKNDGALKRRKEHCQKIGKVQKKEGNWGKLLHSPANTLCTICFCVLNYTQKLLTPLHTPRPPLVCRCRRQGRGLPRTQ